MSLNLAHFFELAAETHRDRPAVLLDDYRFTYGEVNAFVKRIANVLRDLGIEKGDKVAVMLPNTPHFPMVYFGILTLGATVVPINVLLRSNEIAYLLEDSDSKVFIVWRTFYEEAERAFQETEACHHMLVVSTPTDLEPPRVGGLLAPLLFEAPAECDLVETMPDDTAVILYTSGTTGHPKGAELTHFNLFFNAYYAKERIVRSTPDDVVLAVLPLFHSFGQTCIMNATFMAGASMTLVPQFDTDRVMNVIQRDKVTLLALVPTMFHFILNHANTDHFDFSSVRMAISGGSALPWEVLTRFKERFGVQILEGYGLTETSPVATFNTTDKPCKPGSIGHPIWGCEMRIMREDGSFAGPNEVGEVVIRGHNVMKGYYKKPLVTEETIVNGWLHTGDIGKVDEEGYFYIVDRVKDVIIRGGMNVYPREIEEVLHGHPSILEAAVVGVPDELRGEEVKAYLVLREGHSLSGKDIQAYCLERMAKYKCPKEIEIISALPKGPTGKVLKRELRLAAGRTAV